MRRRKLILKAGTILCFLSFCVVAFVLYRFSGREAVDPVISDCEINGLSYEIIIDLFGEPDRMSERMLSWDEGPAFPFGRLQNNFPLMQPEDTVQIKVLKWEYPDGRQREVFLYWAHDTWWVFRNLEWPDYVIIG